jgi:hypothetical protein
MKLFDTAHYSDYGEEYYFQLFPSYPKFAVIDCAIQWDQFPATEIFPMLLVSIGSRSLCGFSFRWKWFQIKCDMITIAPRNLEYYRRTYD